MTMRIAFVCGPYKGESHFEVKSNMRVAERTALDLWFAGFAVICPHLNSAWMSGAVPEDNFYSGYLEILGQCDLVVLCGDWRLSSGALAEKSAAEAAGIYVAHNVEEAIKWRKAIDGDSSRRDDGTACVTEIG